MYRSKTSRGFTIIEILVVIGVIAILTTISAVSFVRYQVDARDSQRANRAVIISEALEKYYDKNGEYPSCSAMTAAGATVTTTTLPGVDPAVLITPKAVAGETNSIDLCTALSASSSTDSFAYVGDGSATCDTGTSCLQYSLQYVDETTGTVKTITSRRTTDFATSGNITDLATTMINFQQIDLNWSDIANSSSYVVQMDSSASFNAGTLSQWSTTSSDRSVTGLVAGTAYYFRVAPVSITGQGSWSNIRNATTLELATPTITATTNSSSQITASWGAITYATSYSLQRATNSAFSAGLVTTSLTGTSSAATGLTAGTTYYFRVQALATGDTSNWSNTASATTIVPVPTGLAVVTNSSTVFTESWNAVSAATDYTVQCSNDNASWGTGCQATVTAPTTAYAYGGAQQGTIYYVRVRANVGAVSSAWSGSVSTITTVDTPAAPSITAYRPGAVRNTADPYWIPGQNFSAGSGNYYYAYATASASCPGGNYPVYQFTSRYNAPATLYSQGATTAPTWYMIQNLSGYDIKFSAAAYCQGPNTNSGWSGWNQSCAGNPGSTKACSF